MSGQVSLRESRKETELEHNKYQEAWHNLQASPQDAQKLHQLALYCQTHFPTNKRPIQVYQPAKHDRASARAGEGPSMPFEIETLQNQMGMGFLRRAFPLICGDALRSRGRLQHSGSKGIESLDMLYMQAIMLEPIFLRKVQEVGIRASALCAGCLKDEYVPASDPSTFDLHTGSGGVHIDIASRESADAGSRLDSDGESSAVADPGPRGPADAGAAGARAAPSEVVGDPVAAQPGGDELLRAAADRANHASRVPPGPVAPARASGALARSSSARNCACGERSCCCCLCCPAAEPAAMSGEMSLLKSVDRAVDKVARSYNNKVYMLLDVVRQCIVVEDIGDMLVVMQLLQQACILKAFSKVTC